MNIERRQPPFSVTRLTATDAASFRDLRINGLRERPEAFGSSWEDEECLTEAQFAESLERNAVFGARTVDCARIVGAVGLSFPGAAKIKHKAILQGMYVRPEAPRLGVGVALVTSAISYATGKVEEVLLTVGVSNTSASELYRKTGFTQYGPERRALKIDQIYYDEILMFLAV